MRVPFRSEAAGPDKETTPETTREVDTDARPASGPGLDTRLVEGAKAGLMATLTMTVFRLPLARSLPPTARFWTKFVSGGDPDDHPVPAIALHLLYGVFGGIGFGLFAPMETGRDAAGGPETDEHEETARNEAVGLLAGALYGLALSVFGERVVLERVLDMDPAADERLVFHAGHLVYGLSLGTWFGSRTSDEEQQDR